MTGPKTTTTLQNTHILPCKYVNYSLLLFTSFFHFFFFSHFFSFFLNRTFISIGDCPFRNRCKILPSYPSFLSLPVLQLHFLCSHHSSSSLFLSLSLCLLGMYIHDMRIQNPHAHKTSRAKVRYSKSLLTLLTLSFSFLFFFSQKKLK